MALEALSSNELFNFIIYDTISATPCNSIIDSNNNSVGPAHHQRRQLNCSTKIEAGARQQPCMVAQVATAGKKKRKRKARVCKNKEEAETQRMIHIAVERNRRKQMNGHLAVLRSLMPESYAQRGDQASIVGGAIEFVKELEHLLQSLEAQKLTLLQQRLSLSTPNNEICNPKMIMPTPFAQFFVYPQYSCWTHIPNNYRSSSKQAGGIADIEVTLVDTHANLRILSRKCFRQLPKLVSAFQSLYLSILHLSVTTLDPLVLYSINAKVEEGCQLTSVDDIANAVHHMLRIIEDEAATSTLLIC